MLKAWADANGKSLHFLVNSGCMNYCSGQSFHDNLVAHEAEIAETTGLSKGTVKSTASRAVAKLGQIMKAQS